VRTVGVKICGLTREEDVRAACEAGADFLGFVFYPKSKRYVEPQVVCKFIELVREFTHAPIPVAVTVDVAFEQLIMLHKQTGIDWFQLHGKEPPELVERLKQAGLRTIKAVFIGHTQVLPPWQPYNSDFFLCDTLDARQPGGTGRSWEIDWLPQDFPLHRTFLAGGLNCDNVAARLAKAHPFAVDISSGVEIAPGIKDVEKIRRFVEIVRTASVRLERQTQ
jgi:phosphoribosylanthranilate isomerase